MRYCSKSLSAALSVAFTLTGCAAVSTPTVPKPDSIKQRIDTLYTLSKQPLGASSKTSSKDSNQDAGSAAASNPVSDGSSQFMSASDYARAGYTLVDENCNDFFDALSRATNTLQMSKSDWTAAGAAAAAIVALAHSASKPVGITAAVFGLGAVTFDNYQKYALLTPYPEQTHKLVFQALKAYATDSPATGASDMIGADARISGYAQICTYSGIATLAQDAIAKSSATVAPNQGSKPSIFTSANETDKVNAIKTALGLSAISDQDLALLAIMVDPAASKYQAKAAAGLSADAKAKVWDSTTSKPLNALATIKDDLASLQSSNSDFAKMIADSEKASGDATKKAGEGVRGGTPPVVFIPPTPPASALQWSPPTIVVNPK